MTKAIQIRIDDKLKRESDRILEHLGLDAPTAVRLFLRRVVMTKSIPFRIDSNLTENGFTPEFEDEIIKASREPSIGPFDSAEEAIAYLHKQVKKK